MEELLKALKKWAALYKDDPEGLRSDFELMTGFSIDEMLDLIDDEIQGHNA